MAATAAETVSTTTAPLPALTTDAEMPAAQVQQPVNILPSTRLPAGSPLRRLQSSGAVVPRSPGGSVMVRRGATGMFGWTLLLVCVVCSMSIQSTDI